MERKYTGALRIVTIRKQALELLKEEETLEEQYYLPINQSPSDWYFNVYRPKQEEFNRREKQLVIEAQGCGLKAAEEIKEILGHSDPEPSEEPNRRGDYKTCPPRAGERSYSDSASVQDIALRYGKRSVKNGKRNSTECISPKNLRAKRIPWYYDR